MKVVIVDDEALAIDEVCAHLSLYNVEIVGKYMDSGKALDNLIVDKPDVVFMDIDMPGLSGIDLAYQIQNIKYDIIIIFVTAYPQYAVDAFRVHALDYILKPLRASSFAVTMDYVSNQYELVQLKKLNEKKDRLFINCLGRLEVVNKNQDIMKFSTQKCKDLLSYILCNADGTITRDDLIRQVFPGEKADNALNNYYVTLYRLRNSLANFGFTEDVFVIKKNYDVFIRDGVCDFVDFKRFLRKFDEVKIENVALAEKFIAAYYGDLFTDLDLEWTIKAREWVGKSMEKLMLSVLEYYSDVNMTKGERILRKALEMNPESTRVLKAALEFYKKLDNKKESERLLLQYKRLIRV
ncbi:MAG: histidine kinase [Anaerocolumna sp.]|nr:histidine kinase [Anaerocolumna sp.]